MIDDEMPDDRTASPACALHEAPDAYRGYLAPAEIAAVLQALVAQAARDGRTALAGRLGALAAALPAPAASPPADLAGLDAATAFARLLPRIRDDGLHARLRDLRDAFPADLA